MLDALHTHTAPLNVEANPARLSRRHLLAQSMALPATALLAGLQPLYAHAGGQLEEPLADSVRGALAAAVASSSVPPIPVFADKIKQQHYVFWLARTSERLHQRRHFMGEQERTELLQTVWYEAKRARLDVSLVLGLITVESNFRKYAISRVGARGLMQIMPFWSRVIGDGDASRLFHMQTNLRFGCVILRHYLDREKGDEFLALGRYNGSRGQAKYPDAVFAAQSKWTL